MAALFRFLLGRDSIGPKGSLWSELAKRKSTPFFSGAVFFRAVR